jgi:hypothetical protein
LQQKLGNWHKGVFMFWIRRKLSICAIIATRNEAHYLKVLLPILAEQKIDVAIVDNGSTDESYELYSNYRGKPIILVETLAYRGVYSLSELLAKKQEIIKKIKHDWIINHDSDEIMEHRQPGLTLRDAICEADEGNYNAINFDEFVFLPEPDIDYSYENHYTNLLRYYFFEPSKNRLNRAWKRNTQLNNLQSGGHLLRGNDLSIAPNNQILRHYIVLSQDYAWKKYLNRPYDPECIARGWHGNKLNFTVKNLTLPNSSDLLFRLSRYDSKEFFRDKPASKHFWEWANNP